MSAAMVSTVLFAGCGRKNGGGKPSLHPTLTTQANHEEPLLLENFNPQPATEPQEAAIADNSQCYVCHVNFSREKLTLVHAHADIGCEKCHALSEAHCSDEDNVTPPDIMYPPEKINPFCLRCHAQDKIDIKPHAALFAGTATEKKYCTDCHGKHRLAHRTRTWDKTTGQLLTDDKVRMMTENRPK